ncbi:shikimate kinase [Arhodomonas aquaeolei]|uniref:shikimate kinase n=1 Tax=Arhodomonas aquaeolei TaxID=2369 RepID=UPI00037CA74E|nr:shikimate kinase [Arhodomonas aquaeolei]
MTGTRDNVVLIGMPGAGKSTVGVLLAKRLGKAFVDTDVLIQQREGRSLQAIVDAGGAADLRRIEGDTLAGLEVHDHVIATGGSAVYSERAMAHLRRDGVIVYLSVPWPEIERRIHNLDSRGIARDPAQSLRAVYDERVPLYRAAADLCVDCTGLGQHECMEQVASGLAARGAPD